MSDMTPYPFCGSTDIDASFARGYKGGDMSKPMIAAGCMDCSCTGPDVVMPNNGPGYKESIAAWNKRAEPKGKA